MKKVISIIIATIIALNSVSVACTAFAKDSTSDAEVTILNSEAKTKIISQKKVKRAYKKKVDKLIKKYGKSFLNVAEFNGYSPESKYYAPLSYCVTGISFLKLIDMNNDGVKEMIVVYAVPIEECSLGGAQVEYHLAVYTYNGKKAVKAGGYEVMAYSSGTRPTVQIANLKSGKKCLFDEGASLTADFYVLKGKKLKKIKFRVNFDGRLIDGKKVTPEYYFDTEYMKALDSEKSRDEYAVSYLTEEEAKTLIKQNKRAYKSLKAKKKKSKRWGKIKGLNTVAYAVTYEDGTGYDSFVADFKKVKGAKGYQVALCWDGFDNVDAKCKTKSNHIMYGCQDYGTGIKIRAYKKTKSGKTIYGPWKKIRFENGLDKKMKRISAEKFEREIGSKHTAIYFE